MTTKLSLEEQFVLACDLAAKHHAGQYDKAGVAYIFHIAHVVESVHTLRQKILAALHDIVEDTSVTLELLRSLGFDNSIVGDVALLTYSPDLESREEYIKDLSESIDCRMVKIADLLHNLKSVRYGRKLTDRELAYQRRRLDEYSYLISL